jgi:hypothetical protein
METDPVSEMKCSLEYQTIDKIQTLSNPNCYTPSSESFIIKNDILGRANLIVRLLCWKFINLKLQDGKPQFEEYWSSLHRLL